MPANYSSNQVDKYLHYKSGSTMLLGLGRELAKFGNDVFTKVSNLDSKEKEAIKCEVAQWQKEIVQHFECGSGVGSSVGRFIFQLPEHKVSLVKLNIISLIFFKLIYENQCSVALGCILSGCSAGDSEGYSVLNYRAVVGALLVENVLILEAEERSGGLGGFIALSRDLMESLVGKFCVPFFTSKDIGILRATKEAKAKKTKEKKVAAIGHSSKSTPFDNSVIPFYSAQEIETRLRYFVIGHEDVIRALSCRLSLHLQKARMILAGESVSAPNEVVLVIGSPSSGKSYLASCLPKVLYQEGKTRIPYFSVSASDLTETGYVGMDVEVIPKGLISNAQDSNIARAGIAFIDELDKRAFKSSAANSTDISAGMQYGLLKLVEGSEMLLGEKRGNYEKPMRWNSYGAFFLLGGAFDGLDSIMVRRMKKSGGIGFSNMSGDKQDTQMLTDALVDFGISRQLLSRCTSIIRLQDPSIEELLRIISFNKGILASYNQILAPITVALSDEAKLMIAEHAYETKTFSRGMKRIVSRLIEEVVYHQPKGAVELQVEDVRAVLDESAPEPNTTTVLADSEIKPEPEPCSVYGG